MRFIWSDALSKRPDRPSKFRARPSMQKASNLQFQEVSRIEDPKDADQDKFYQIQPGSRLLLRSTWETSWEASQNCESW